MDVGCGSKPYRELFDVDEYIGIDIEVSGHNHSSSNIDKFYDGKVIPFENNALDHNNIFFAKKATRKVSVYRWV